MTHPPSGIDIHAMIEHWRARHARGELGNLMFERDIAPLIRAACASYVSCNGSRPQMRQCYRTQVEYMVRLRTTSRQVDCVAEHCWRALENPTRA
ncbi:hypothetical protein P6166_04755 [Stenotrophomonas sp. HITSZ_GD]|uniref:hypothetical protein n=1 Tax=Stenotrophomonas sp. HITSZ_GD TaxID=3037248 RepID=UPI00240E107A|nr:hypothetical protein [Stenotrophomonas sp. HITSZ_GD]MDG2524668.1 hypothetical protein [Stenotrophomonas sp. HITSZ_GD]